VLIGQLVFGIQLLTNQSIASSKSPEGVINSLKIPKSLSNGDEKALRIA
jgi:hypothetical protein